MSYSNPRGISSPFDSRNPANNLGTPKYASTPILDPLSPAGNRFQEGSFSSSVQNHGDDSGIASSPRVALSGFRASSNRTPDFVYKRIMSNPDAHFDPTVQEVNELLEEIRTNIANYKNIGLSNAEASDIEARVGRILEDVSNVNNQLMRFIEDTTSLGNLQRNLTPRTVNTIRTRESIVAGLINSTREVRINFQRARDVRNREELLPEFNGLHQRSSRRQKDSEELVSNSTERLLQSKRILMQVTQTSSATLSELASSSQAITNNQKELGNQADAVGSAKSLLTKYGRRASTDRLLIWLAYLLFIVVVLFILYRRIL